MKSRKSGDETQVIGSLSNSTQSQKTNTSKGPTDLKSTKTWVAGHRKILTIIKKSLPTSGDNALRRNMHRPKYP